MRFRPDIKPPMWGPPSAVARAVRHYFEDVLGAPSPIVYFPLNELAGTPNDIMSLRTVSKTGSPAWFGAGIRNTASPYYYSFSRFSISPPFTILYRAKQATAASTNGMVCGDVTATDDFIWMNGGTNFYLRASGTTISWGLTDFTQTINYALIIRAGANNNTLARDSTILPGGIQAAISSFKCGAIGAGYNSASYGLIGDLEYFGIVPAALSDQAAMEFNAAPYAPLMPYSPPVYFDMAASGGATLETISKAALSMLGKSLTSRSTFSIPKTSLSLAGKTTTVAITTIVPKAQISLTGKAVQAVASSALAVCSLALSGKAVKHSIVSIIGKAGISLRGMGVTVFGEITRRIRSAALSIGINI